MTKAEAAVMRAALRYWRAQKKHEETKDIKDPSASDKALKDLLIATEAAAKEVKDWVAIKDTPNPNQPIMQCAGCGMEGPLKMPLPMNELMGKVGEFRSKHVDCGPVAEETVGA